MAKSNSREKRRSRDEYFHSNRRLRFSGPRLISPFGSPSLKYQKSLHYIPNQPISARSYLRSHIPTRAVFYPAARQVRVQTQAQAAAGYSPTAYVSGSNSVRARYLICAARQARREVMHALGYAGSGGQKRPRFTPESNVRCS